MKKETRKGMACFWNEKETRRRMLCVFFSFSPTQPNTFILCPFLLSIFLPNRPVYVNWTGSLLNPNPNCFCITILLVHMLLKPPVLLTALPALVLVLLNSSYFFLAYSILLSLFLWHIPSFSINLSHAFF
jgi:hypothetical protein